MEVSNTMNTYKVKVVGIGIIVADVLVDAISSEDAAEIAKTSLKPEDYEVVSADVINSIETMEM